MTPVTGVLLQNAVALSAQLQPASNPPIVPSVSFKPVVMPKLPKLTLTPFGGNVKDWPLFYSDFCSLVDSSGLDN